MKRQRFDPKMRLARVERKTAGFLRQIDRMRDHIDDLAKERMYLRCAAHFAEMRVPIAHSVVNPLQGDQGDMVVSIGALNDVGSAATAADLRDLQRTQDQRAQEISEYRKRHGIKAARLLTVASHSDGNWMMQRLEPTITRKVVVEIGAGCGTLATMMARVAKHVFAIEADAEFSQMFTANGLKKPTNLTWIFDAAQSVLPMLKADVAVVVTGSDVDALRDLAGQFAPTVVMPWQDWREGRAVVATGWPLTGHRI